MKVNNKQTTKQTNQQKKASKQTNTSPKQQSVEGGTNQDLFGDSQLNRQRGDGLVLSLDLIVIFIDNLQDHFLTHVACQGGQSLEYVTLKVRWLDKCDLIRSRRMWRLYQWDRLQSSA
jgi:hypothetical protein